MVSGAAAGVCGASLRDAPQVSLHQLSKRIRISERLLQLTVALTLAFQFVRPALWQNCFELEISFQNREFVRRKLCTAHIYLSGGRRFLIVHKSTRNFLV
jgi:hypothetical protein